jgi:hypothetical protein
VKEENKDKKSFNKKPSILQKLRAFIYFSAEIFKIKI